MFCLIQPRLPEYTVLLFFCARRLVWCAHVRWSSLVVPPSREERKETDKPNEVWDEDRVQRESLLCCLLLSLCPSAPGRSVGFHRQAGHGPARGGWPPTSALALLVKMAAVAIAATVFQSFSASRDEIRTTHQTLM